MKAITSLVTSLRITAFTSGPEAIFDPDTISSRYETALTVKIPNTLEGDEKVQKPFTQRDADSDTYGNGRVGYTIFNIDRLPSYQPILRTGHGYADELGEFERVVEFYKRKELRKYINSFSSRDHCMPADNTTSDIVKDEPEEPVAIIAGFGVVGAVLGLLLIGIAIAIIISKYRCW